MDNARSARDVRFFRLLVPGATARHQPQAPQLPVKLVGDAALNINDGVPFYA